ncbi:unnamed protein product [Lactuca saligna]|uniref:F-box domain-containing protein n=1 Tax=Lactuca saligna TaxID=75948 RepID=A0AA35Z8G4_LACSI|nr:unnamed protein product [Lactuca saligna]
MSRRNKSRKKSVHKRRTRKSKKVKVDPFIFLPDDILLEILKRLPDAVLRYKEKYVCSRWFDIITNSILLDHASYILQNKGTFRTCLVDIREEGERLQVKEQDLDIPHIGMIRSWCNEFLLISVSYTNTLYVYNLITKEGSYLPQHNAPCGRYCIGNCGVALSGFKGIYKVVHLYSGPPIKCHILNLGRGDNLMSTCVSSKWKHVKGSFTKDVKNRLHSWCEPVLVRQGRYIHWETFNDSNDLLVSMDTETEEIFQKRLPTSIEERYSGNSLFVIGGFLAVFDRVLYQGNDAYVWILKDFRRRRWKKLQLITGHYTRYLDTYRICGGISKRYIILRSTTGKGMCSYDVENGVFKELDISIGSDHDHFVVHSSAPIKI